MSGRPEPCREPITNQATCAADKRCAAVKRRRPLEAADRIAAAVLFIFHFHPGVRLCVGPGAWRHQRIGPTKLYEPGSPADQACLSWPPKPKPTSAPRSGFTPNEIRIPVQGRLPDQPRCPARHQDSGHEHQHDDPARPSVDLESQVRHAWHVRFRLPRILRPASPHELRPVDRRSGTSCSPVKEKAKECLSKPCRPPA